MNTFSVVLTVLATLFVVAAILLFERRRARQIQRDLRDMGPPPERGDREER